MATLEISGTASGKTTGYILVGAATENDVLHANSIAANSKTSDLDKTQAASLAAIVASHKAMSAIRQFEHDNSTKGAIIQPHAADWSVAWYRGYWKINKNGRVKLAQNSHVTEDFDQCTIILLDEKFNVMNVGPLDATQPYDLTGREVYCVVLDHNVTSTSKIFCSVQIPYVTYSGKIMGRRDVVAAPVLIQGLYLAESCLPDAEPYQYEGRPPIFLFEAAVMGPYQWGDYMTPGAFIYTWDKTADYDQFNPPAAPKTSTTGSPLRSIISQSLTAFRTQLQKNQTTVDSIMEQDRFSKTPEVFSGTHYVTHFQVRKDGNSRTYTWEVESVDTQPALSVTNTNCALYDSGNGFRLVRLDMTNDLTAPGAIPGAFLIALAQSSRGNSVFSIVPWALEKDFLADGSMILQGFSDGLIYVSRLITRPLAIKYRALSKRVDAKITRQNRYTRQLTASLGAVHDEDPDYRDLGVMYATTRSGVSRGSYYPIADQNGIVHGGIGDYTLDHALLEDEVSQYLDEATVNIDRGSKAKNILAKEQLADILLIPGVNFDLRRDENGEQMVWPNGITPCKIDSLTPLGGVIANAVHKGTVNDHFQIGVTEQTAASALQRARQSIL